MAQEIPISSPARTERILRHLAESILPAGDEACLPALVRQLGTTLPGTWVYLLEVLDPKACRLCSIAGWGPTGLQERFEVEARGTIFESFLDRNLRVAMWAGNRTLLPRPVLPTLSQGLGMGLFDAKETLIGALVVLSEEPIDLDGPLESAFEIYAARAQAELDRGHAVKALQQEVQQRRIAEEDLDTSYRDLRDLAHHLQSIQEEERGRIAAQIHDELGQLLTALKIDCAFIQRSLVDPGPKLEERFRSIASLIDTTVQTVRRMATELRPQILDELGLISAMQWQLQDHQGRTGLTYHFTFEPEDLQVKTDIATAIFRSFQELLVNVLRHAEARHVEVRLSQRAEILELTVKDDGKGFSSRDLRSSNSFGLLQIQERARYWGGTMSIETSHGAGTQVSLDFPLENI